MSIVLRPYRRLALALLPALGLAATAPAAAQQAQPAKPAAPKAQTVPAPAPVESQPLAPLTPAPGAVEAQAAPAPAPSPAPSPAPAPAQAPDAGSAPPAAPAAPPLQSAEGPTTLAPAPADPSVPDEVQIAGRPAAALRAQSTWDDGYETLTGAFQKLQAAMDKAGIKVTGRPLSVFIETDDMGFRFEAQVPIEAAPAARPQGLPSEISFTTTPSGKAIRFVHRAPYDDIDSTYEAISAYLDSKGIEVKDAFTEEYVNPGANAGDPGLDLNIYVLPKE
ncbi:MAG: GyrI-like domain-containing protein [Alsobacter sp.]